MKSEKEKVKISVIMPVYNVEKYVAECIESVLNQTMADFELIIVDDGSKDSSAEICASYANQDKRIRFFTKNNGGVSSARNLGLNHAEGKYITFIDSDDLYAEIYLKTLFDLAEKHDADITIGNMAKYYGPGDTAPVLPVRGCTVVLQGQDIIDFQKKIMIRGIDELNKKIAMPTGYVWGKLYRGRMLRDQRIFFCEDVWDGQEGLFNIVAAQFSRKIVYTDKIIYYYRIVEQSMSNGYYPNALKVYEAENGYMRNFVEKYKKGDIDFSRGVGIRICTWLYKSLNRCYFHPRYLSEHGFRHAKKEVLGILKREPYISAFQDVYFPYLTSGQKLFCFAMKHRMLNLVYLMLNMRERGRKIWEKSRR